MESLDLDDLVCEISCPDKDGNEDDEKTRQCAMAIAQVLDKID